MVPFFHPATICAVVMSRVSSSLRFTDHVPGGMFLPGAAALASLLCLDPIVVPSNRKTCLRCAGVSGSNRHARAVAPRVIGGCRAAPACTPFACEPLVEATLAKGERGRIAPGGRKTSQRGPRGCAVYG